MIVGMIKRQSTPKASTSLTVHILADPLNPFPWYRVLRERHPVYYSPNVVCGLKKL
jgi:hypothetical protein